MYQFLGYIHPYSEGQVEVTGVTFLAAERMQEEKRKKALFNGSPTSGSVNISSITQWTISHW